MIYHIYLLIYAYNFDMIYRSREDNIAAGILSKIPMSLSVGKRNKLTELQLCYPGLSREKTLLKPAIYFRLIKLGKLIVRAGIMPGARVHPR